MSNAGLAAPNETMRFVRIAAIWLRAKTTVFMRCGFGVNKPCLFSAAMRPPPDPRPDWRWSVWEVGSECGRDHAEQFKHNRRPKKRRIARRIKGRRDLDHVGPNDANA